MPTLRPACVKRLVLRSTGGTLAAASGDRGQLDPAIKHWLAGWPARWGVAPPGARTKPDHNPSSIVIPL